MRVLRHAAALTLAEFEDRLQLEIRRYHNTVPEALGRTPLAAWADMGGDNAGRQVVDAEGDRLKAGELDQDEIKQRLARIAGQELGEEHDHSPGQGDRDIRGRLAEVLGKARAEDQEREKARQKEREPEIDEERRRRHELDRGLGWEL